MIFRTLENGLLFNSLSGKGCINSVAHPIVVSALGYWTSIVVALSLFVTDFKILLICYSLVITDYFQVQASVETP